MSPEQRRGEVGTVHSGVVREIQPEQRDQRGAEVHQGNEVDIGRIFRHVSRPSDDQGNTVTPFVDVPLLTAPGTVGQVIECLLVAVRPVSAIVRAHDHD